MIGYHLLYMHLSIYQLGFLITKNLSKLKRNCSLYAAVIVVIANHLEILQAVLENTPNLTLKQKKNESLSDNFKPFASDGAQIYMQFCSNVAQFNDQSVFVECSFLVLNSVEVYRFVICLVYITV